MLFNLVTFFESTYVNCDEKPEYTGALSSLLFQKTVSLELSIVASIVATIAF